MDWVMLIWAVLWWCEIMLTFAGLWMTRGAPRPRSLYPKVAASIAAFSFISFVAFSLLSRWEPWGGWIAAALGIGWSVRLIGNAAKLLFVTATQDDNAATSR